MARSRKHRTKTTTPKRTVNKTDIFFVIFVVAWTILSLTISQTLVALVLRLIAGPSISAPFWTLVFYILRYALTLASVIFLPPRLWRLLHDRRRTESSQTAQKSKPLTKSNLSQSAENPFNTTPEELGVSKWPTFIDLGLAPIGYIVYILFATVLTGLMSMLFSWFNADQAQDVGFAYFLTTSDRILAMLAIVFVAPIFEELIMRGWLYGKIRNKLGAIISTIIVSLVFAVLHGQWNVGVSVFILSLVLCALREITGTIWSGMLLHILSNGIAFYIVYVMGGLAL